MLMVVLWPLMGAMWSATSGSSAPAVLFCFIFYFNIWIGFRSFWLCVTGLILLFAFIWKNLRWHPLIRGCKQGLLHQLLIEFNLFVHTKKERGGMEIMRAFLLVGIIASLISAASVIGGTATFYSKYVRKCLYNVEWLFELFFFFLNI